MRARDACPMIWSVGPGVILLRIYDGDDDPEPRELPLRPAAPPWPREPLEQDVPDEAA